MAEHDKGAERALRATLGDPGGAIEPSRVDFGRSNEPIEPLRAPKVARGGRSRGPRSRFGSILGRPNLENRGFRVRGVAISTKSTFSLPEAILARFWSLRGGFECSWATLSASQGALGPPWGAPGTLLGRSWGTLGAPLAPLGTLFGALGACLGAPRGPGPLPGPISDRFWSIFGPILVDFRIDFPLESAFDLRTDVRLDWLSGSFEVAPMS